MTKRVHKPVLSGAVVLSEASIEHGSELKSMFYGYMGYTGSKTVLKLHGHGIESAVLTLSTGVDKSLLPEMHGGQIYELVLRKRGEPKRWTPHPDAHSDFEARARITRAFSALATAFGLIGEAVEWRDRTTDAWPVVWNGKEWVTP